MTNGKPMRCNKRRSNDNKGITNVLGALLFILAIVSITSMIAIVSNEYSSYVRSSDYMYSIERQRSSEVLTFQHSVNDTYLILNMTNTGNVQISIVSVLVHNRTTNVMTDLTPVIDLNPGMARINYNSSVKVTASSNATILFVTNTGNAFLIVINGEYVLYKS